jgi:hypothetical protein
LVVSDGLIPGGRIDGAKSAGHGGDGLHASANPEWATGAHATFNPAGTLAQALDARPVVDNLVVGFGTAASGGRETITDLNALDGLDSHERPSES